MNKIPDTTPMMKQYLEIKSKYSDTFLFFRMGDFYEMFFDDAVNASKILNITLTSRGQHNGADIPMCGVPYHSVDNYLAKMIAANQKVAICEQVEDPKYAKGVVKRQVQRVVTPGTLIDDALLKSNKNNYLASLHKTGANWGLSYCEITTGEYKVTEMKSITELERELSRIEPSEIIISKSTEKLLSEKNYLQNTKFLFISQADWIYEFKHANNLLCSHFKIHSLDGFGLNDYIPGICSAGAILYYVTESCLHAVDFLNIISKYDLCDFMPLDEATKRNLELVEKPLIGNSTTLIDVLDYTKTPMGGRTLRNWIHSPLIQMEKINERQEAVSELKNEFSHLNTLQDILKKIYDIERIIGRICCKNANPRDLITLRNSILLFPSLRDVINLLKSQVFKSMKDVFLDFKEITEKIDGSIDSNAPVSMKEGNVIKEGFNAELDELRDISKNAKIKILEIQKDEIQKTGIKNLKIKFNNVFGYYIEISKGQLGLVPDYFIRKQTLVNAERFITEDLKILESKILGAEQKSIALEQNLFNDIRDFIAGFGEQIKLASANIGILDSLLSLANASITNNYTRPELSNNNTLIIKEGRHPVVEKLINSGEFISNETVMDSGTNQILIITGPNMAGKSTYIRQVGLIVLMAQIGSHVPAKEASIGIVDRIFTRVGAYDDLSKGKSTFMVEMNETANILNNATSKSLIILDEIGRGTSTFDGISIAWSIIEYLYYCSDIKARTLFATHYHELTSLEYSLKGVKNFNISVKEWNDEIMFLHKIVEGAADKSYGIHVARLAGLPLDVIKRSKELLSKLESGGMQSISIPKVEIPKATQMELFSISKTPCIPNEIAKFIKELSSIDASNVTPLQALNILSDYVEKCKNIKDKQEL